MIEAKQEIKDVFCIFSVAFKAILVVFLVFLLSISFSPLPAFSQDLPFSDLPTWGREEILDLHQAGIVSGYPNGTFQPERAVSRAEFAKMVVLAFSFPSASPPIFQDVTYDYWASPFISGAQVQGWIEGFPDGTFRPQAEVTRAQAIAILSRILQLGKSSWLYSQEASSWANEILAQAIAKGIIKESDPYFDLSRQFGDLPASRVEVAVFLDRSLNYLRSSEASSPKQVAQGLDEEVSYMLSLINEERERNALHPLEWDEELAGFANSYAQEMGENNFFSHVSPFSGSFQERAKVLFDQGFKLVGENLSRLEAISNFDYQTILNSMHQSFMGSSTHKSNILNPDWSSVGIGIWSNGDVLYLVETFGERK